MTSPVDICNLALQEIGQQVLIQSFTDTTPAGVVASTQYTPRMQMLLRAANWGFARKTVALTLLRIAVPTSALPAPAYPNPPPQPFLFEYAWPSDCLRGRFLIPYQQTNPVVSTPLTTAPNAGIIAPNPPTGIPFVIATDFDGQGNQIKVILSNLPLAQFVYTADLSQLPDLWDGLFLSAATAVLSTYFITALARNNAQLAGQVTIAKGALDSARMMDGNEGISNVDHLPDYIRIRQGSSIPWLWGPAGGGAYAFGTGYDQCQIGSIWY